MEKLTYTHLPAFAKYLLEERLDDLTAKQIELSREAKMPLMKILDERMKPDDLYTLAKNSIADILKYTIENRLDEQIRVSVLQWRENMLPIILTREQILIDDITLSGYIRKKAMLHFLREYTSDIEKFTAIVSEYDYYIQKSEAASFEAFMDIQRSHMREANAALEESEDRYQRMIAEVEDYAIIRLSKNGIIENWNKGAEKIKGYKAEEIIGKSFHLFYTPEDLELGMPERLLDIAAGEGRAQKEGWRVRKDGSRFWGSITITALHDENNNVVGFTKVTRDLTSLKQANDQLDAKRQELERSNKELTSFSYVASHDLQEPLRKIMLFAQLLLDKEGESMSERGKEILGKIHAGTLTMKRLIEDLLSYSRAQSYSTSNTEVDLNTVMREIENAHNEESPERKVIINYPKLPTVKGISFQLYQLFDNIVSNAVKYAKPDITPTVDVAFKVVNGKQVPHQGADFNTDYYQVTLADNGIGFEQQYAEKIFEIFQRLHKKNEFTGTGIGLAICKKIVQNHRGFIEAFGVPDVGATFVIYLPA
jgi:PAS domain S-box-containing protein